MQGLDASWASYALGSHGAVIVDLLWAHLEGTALKDWSVLGEDTRVDHHVQHCKHRCRRGGEDSHREEEYTFHLC